MSPALWTLLGGVAVAAITGAVSLLVATLNRRPTQQTVDVSTLQAAADEWRELKDDYRARLETVETQLDKVTAENKHLRSQVEQLTVRLDASAGREKVRDEHIVALEDHIINQLPPPPPRRPF